MGNVPVVANGTPRNITDWSRDGVSVGELKSAVEKAMGIPRDKQRVFVGLLDVTNCEDSKTFCTSSYGEIYVVDDAHSHIVPEYVVALTDFEGKSREVVLQPSPDITKLKAQLVRNMGLKVTDLDAFEAVCNETGILDNDGMLMFKPWNTLRLVHRPFKMNCTIVITGTGKARCVEADIDPKWTAMNVIKSLGIPIGEYTVAVDGKPCDDWCHALTWNTGAHDGSLFHIEVCTPYQKFQIFVKNLDGRTLTFEVNSFWTVGMVKLLIRDKKGFPCDDQRLIFKGK